MKKVIFPLLLGFSLLIFLQNEAAACTCVRDKIKAKGFSGRVIIQTAPQTKEPLSNAIVKLLKRTDSGDKVIAEVATNEEGRFAIENVESGKYILEAEAVNFQKVSTEIKIVKGSSKKKELEIGLEVGITCCVGYATVRRTK